MFCRRALLGIINTRGRRIERGLCRGRTTSFVHQAQEAGHTKYCVAHLEVYGKVQTTTIRVVSTCEFRHSGYPHGVNHGQVEVVC